MRLMVWVRLTVGLSLLSCAIGKVGAQIDPPDDPQIAQNAKAVAISSSSNHGLREIAFRTRHGLMVARIPDELRGGDSLWGTVLTEPAGSTSEERSLNRAALQKLQIELTPNVGSAVTVASRTIPAKLKIPPDCSQLNVSLYEPSTKTIFTVPRKCAPQMVPTGTDNNHATLPQVASPGQPFRCGMNGSGNPGDAFCNIGNKPCPPLAGNNRCQWFQTPKDAVTGQAPITCIWPSQHKAARGRVSVVKPELSADQLLHVGDRGQVRIKLPGLKGVKGAKLVFRNESPGIVTVSGGDDQVIPIRGQ